MRVSKKGLIWCEMVCCNCNRVIGAYYKNAKTISKLKNKTKDWSYCDDKGNLCPECYKKLKEYDKNEQ